MKFLLAIFSLVALCAANAIPAVPKDNSHYVEGVSRYIWMPDGQGTLQLVDLQAPVEEKSMQRDSSNAYWLYTRDNPTNYQVLVNGDESSVTASNYNGDLPTLLLAHGWTSSGSTDWALEVTAAQLEVDDYNVIVLDWSDDASGLYTTSVLAVPQVGVDAGSFLEWLFATAGGDWSNVHLAGHSLGAHVVGNIGRSTGSLARRVTGLDPAGPLWWTNSNALSTDSGVYVESIHTDGYLLGIMTPISHADFYPNGGTNPQPGCILSTCSHGRAPLFFAASILYDSFVGQLCADLDEASDNACTGSTLNMGNSDLTKTGAGLYGLTTGSEWPY